MLSPMMKQYFDIKSQYNDAVLFFRLGDFYEMFFDEAINISKELELTLTGRDCGMSERAPMCGIPYHASEIYIKRLIDKGYKVAICEQVTDPKTSNGLVEREVVRVVTPGTVIESSLLDEERNNFIGTVILTDNSYAVCFADISTGETHITGENTSKAVAEVINELSRFAPKEVLINSDNKEIQDFLNQKLSATVTIIEPCDYERIILSHFNISRIGELGIDIIPNGTAVLGSLLFYLNSTRKDGAKRIVGLEIYAKNSYMKLDLNARRNLELVVPNRVTDKTSTLLYVLDKTSTAMGKRYIRKAIEQPLLNISSISKRQNAIAVLKQNYSKSEAITEVLSNVYDLERLMTRVLYASVNPREVRSLGYTIGMIPQIKLILQDLESGYLKDINLDIKSLTDVKTLIENAIEDNPPIALKDSGIICNGFNDELDSYRELANNAKGVIAQIEEDEKQKTGIKNLKVGYNRVFGYYIEITKSNIGQAPDYYIRKQTLTNCERYITQELKELEAKILTANERILALESEIFNEVRQFIAQNSEDIQCTANAIAKLDFINSLAIVANNNNYICPQISTSGEIIIKDGRHPVIENMFDALFVPNDTLLDIDKNRTMIITGPNMAGKSTYMRQVALITIMAQVGSFVPASDAKISVCDQIFTRVGASDDISRGQSTFMVEMSEVSDILNNATSQSLVILDEIGRGTSTFDGMSIAKSVIEYINESKKLGCKTLFSTHYHELTELEDMYDGIKNYNIAVKKRGDDIIFLRKIIRGGADDSYGIEVAKLAKLPKKVIVRAREILAELEKDNGVVHTHKADDEPVGLTDNQIIAKLKSTSLDTITPLEAMNILFELKTML